MSYDNREIFSGATAILFGSIGSIIETSELQLAAFNKAFKKFGLDWEWTTTEYKPMLLQAGGRKRILEVFKVNEYTSLRRRNRKDSHYERRLFRQIF